MPRQKKSEQVEVVSDVKVDEAGEVQVEKSAVTVEEGEVKSIDPVKVEETPVHEAHHLDVAETHVNSQDEPVKVEEVEEVDKEALKQAILDMRANEEELAQIRASQVQAVESVKQAKQERKARGQDVHKTGIESEKSDRQFYFGGPHARRRK